MIARDAETGQLGVAVQSHYFSVGSVVTSAEAGVGAVATQSLADPAYGKLDGTSARSGYGAMAIATLPLPSPAEPDQR